MIPLALEPVAYTAITLSAEDKEKAPKVSLGALFKYSQKWLKQMEIS